MKNILLIIFFLAFLSCNKDKDNIDTGNTNITISSFPLKIGNKWKYKTHIHFNPNPDPVSQDQDYFFQWEVVSDTIINEKNCKKIKQVSYKNEEIYETGYIYYNNNQEGLFIVAVNNYHTPLHFKKNYKTLKHPFNLLNENKSEGLYILDSPICSLKFPSKIGESWLSFIYPFSHKRIWNNYTTISVNAGIFNCINVIEYNDVNNNNLPDKNEPFSYQIISEKGLIQETFSITLSNPAGDSLTRGVITTKLEKINF